MSKQVYSSKVTVVSLYEMEWSTHERTGHLEYRYNGMSNKDRQAMKKELEVILRKYMDIHNKNLPILE